MVCSICSATESKKWVSGKCITCWNREYYHTKVDKCKEKQRNSSYYKENKERIKEKSAAWANANRDKVRKIASKWALNNRGDKNYEESKRRAAKKMATPKWLTKEDKVAMKEIYRKCPKGHEVDHIIPLQGKEVTGLHVPWNLQYLPMSLNRKKSNRIKEVYFE